MRLLLTGIIGFSIALYVLIIAAMYISGASANDMINNEAYGYVNGSIIQKAGENSTNEINVGSITGKNLKNNKVSATVDGDIFVETKNKETTVLSIGSITRK